MAQWVKNPTAMQETGLQPWVRKISWRTAWQLIPVFLPRESQGHRSLEGCSPQAHKEADMTKATVHNTYTAWVGSLKTAANCADNSLNQPRLIKLVPFIPGHCAGSISHFPLHFGVVIQLAVSRNATHGFQLAHKPSHEVTRSPLSPNSLTQPSLDIYIQGKVERYRLMMVNHLSI